MALNTKKPYSEVCGGSGNIPYRYEQDGKYFDQHYNEVTDKGEKVQGGEYIPPEAERDVVIEEPEPEAAEEFTGMAMGGEEQKPEIIAPEDDGLDKLKRPELFDMLAKLGVTDVNKKTSKDDLVAMVRDEVKAEKQEGDE